MPPARNSGEGSPRDCAPPEQEGLHELGGTMRLGDYTADLREGTLAMNSYKKEIIERHRHRYEVNPQYIPRSGESRVDLLGNQ